MINKGQSPVSPILTFLKAALASVIFLAATTNAQPAAGIPDGVPPDVARNMRRAGDDRIVFCVNPRSTLADFEREFAVELAHSLLLNAELMDVYSSIPSPQYDFRLFLIDSEIFYYLAIHCDAFLGFTVLADYPPWLTVSPVYLTTETALVTRSSSGYASPTDIPVSSSVGVRSLSLADGYLTTYLQALPSSRRLGRILYPDHGVLIDRLLDATVEAILVWEPALYAYQRDHGNDLDSLQVIRNSWFQIPPTEFALALRPQETYLNQLLSEGIKHMKAEGILEQLAVKHGIVGSGTP